jgi:hypothetical protein
VEGFGIRGGEASGSATALLMGWVFGRYVVRMGSG